MGVVVTTIGSLHVDRASAQAAYERYASQVIPLIEARGGALLARVRPVSSIVHGGRNNHPDLVSIIEFPNAEAALSLFTDPAYLAAIPDRSAAFAHIETFLGHTF